jgi:HSP20 family molecular chaperone IbpA
MSKSIRLTAAEQDLSPKRTTSYIRYHLVQYHNAQRPTAATGIGWVPALDLFETADEYIIEVTLAGIRLEQIRIDFESNQLRISGERSDLDPPGVRCYHVMEIERGPFERALEFPTAVDPDSARAVLEDGMLTLHVTKLQGGQIHGCFPADSMEGLE